MDSYIGNSPISETAGTRSEWAPTNGQTTFTIQYAIGYLDVFVNGGKLASADFTATNGTSFTLNTAVTDQDHVAAIAWAKGKMAPVDEIFPVGSIWFCAGTADPNGVLPGTWGLMAEGQFLVSAGDVSGDYNLGDTGGEAQHVLTVDEMPSHNHTVDRTQAAASGTSRFIVTTPGGGTAVDSNPTGGDQPHENRPPFLAVNMWVRLL